MGGQLGRIPSILGYLEFRTSMYGGTTREDPEYPGILSHPDTVCEVVCMGGQLGRIPSIPGYLAFRTLSVKGYVWGDNSGGSRVSRDT